jgi:hypothetical protein
MLTGKVIPADAETVVLSAILDQLDEAASVVRELLADHETGDHRVALADARDWVMRIGRLGATLDAIQAPGWIEPLRPQEHPRT